jgi:hypothetical protein
MVPSGRHRLGSPAMSPVAKAKTSTPKSSPVKRLVVYIMWLFWALQPIGLPLTMMSMSSRIEAFKTEWLMSDKMKEVESASTQSRVEQEAPAQDSLERDLGGRGISLLRLID